MHVYYISNQSKIFRHSSHDKGTALLSAFAYIYPISFEDLFDIFKRTSVAAYMKKFIAFIDKSEDIVLLKQFGTFFG